MQNQKSVLLLAEIAIVTALAVVFDYIANLFSVSLFPNGGSISIAMLPIYVLAFRRGLIPGIISGILLGFIQTVIAPPYIAPLNPALGFFLDYPIGFGVVGLAGLFRFLIQSENTLFGIIGVVLGVLIGGIFRLIGLTISGMYCWGLNFVGSFTYNISYMFPSIIVCGILAVLMYVTAKKIFVV